MGDTSHAAQKSSRIGKVMVFTDSLRIRDMVTGLGAEVPFLRPESLAAPQVRVDDVLRQFVQSLEELGVFPDVFVPLEITYPFRPEGLIDEVIIQLLSEGHDTVIAGLPEYRACWKANGNNFELLTDMHIGRDEREPIHIGVPGLACATYPEVIRDGNRIGKKVGIIEIDDPLAGIVVRSHGDYERVKGQRTVF